MASTLTVASDRSYEVFQRRKALGELRPIPFHSRHEAAYVRRAVTVLDRLTEDFEARVREQKRLNKG